MSTFEDEVAKMEQTFTKEFVDILNFAAEHADDTEAIARRIVAMAQFRATLWVDSLVEIHKTSRAEILKDVLESDGGVH
jgi:hypothetical protein